MTFGTRLKSLRNELGLTQTQLAEKIKLSKANVSKYESDTIEPNFETLKMLSLLFNVSIDYLLCKTDYQETFSDTQAEGSGRMIRLKELREEKGISQAKLAKDIGVTYGAVGNWESGTREPKFETVIKIADYFGVSVDYLIGRTNDPSMASDIIVETADGKITTLEDAGLSPEDLSRITAVIGDVVKKYRSAPDEVHEDEPSVLAAHADGITQEEMQEDLSKIKEYIKKKGKQP